SHKLRKQLEAMRQTGMPFEEVPGSAAKGALWVRPELVAEVQFSTWTTDNLVRQASFKGLREDKKATEVRREMPDPNLSQKAAPRQKTTAPEKAPASPRLGFKVTHPEKVVDPQTGVTKQALIDYYLAVAPL